jgi:hypothetical protein
MVACNRISSEFGGELVGDCSLEAEACARAMGRVVNPVRVAPKPLLKRVREFAKIMEAPGEPGQAACSKRLSASGSQLTRP